MPSGRLTSCESKRGVVSEASGFWTLHTMPTRSASGLCASYRTRVRRDDSWCRSSGFLPSCCIAIPRRGRHWKAASDASTGSKAKPVRSRVLRLQLCPHAVSEPAVCQSLPNSCSGARRIGAVRASLCNQDHSSADFRHATPGKQKTARRRPLPGDACASRHMFRISRFSSSGACGS
jgi:hypothetical protein